MKLILLSGGSGKRLWPLSNDARSKQFLKVLRNRRGELQSMVQRVWSQLESAGLEESSYIATNKSQLDVIQNQLGSDVRLIVESERRDTFPAIALASAYLYSEENVGLDEVVVVLPVDPYVEDWFFEKVKGLEEALVETQAELALMGVVPTYPSEKYGYIVPEGGHVNQECVKVSHFREKPKEEQAQELIGQRALWNCGVFAFRLGFMINKIEELGFAPQYKVLREDYSKMPIISFDYEVVEKTNNIVAIRYEGDWKDLGTWNTLTEEMSSALIGIGIMSEDSLNSHMINELDIPVAVLGLSDVVVAASPDGILVSNKKDSPRVKEVVKGFEHRPMFEERRWGWYKVLDHSMLPEGQEILTKRIGIEAGKNLSYQEHFFRSEVWTIVSGTGEFVLNGVIYPVKPGDVLNIPIKARHGIRAVSDLEFIEVQMGRGLVEDDIVRIYMTWDEVEENCVRKLSLNEPKMIG